MINKKTDKDSSVASSRPSREARKRTSANADNKNSPTAAATQPIENSAREQELEKIYSQKTEQLSFILSEINHKIISQDTQPKEKSEKWKLSRVSREESFSQSQFEDLNWQCAEKNNINRSEREKTEQEKKSLRI